MVNKNSLQLSREEIIFIPKNIDNILEKLNQTAGIMVACELQMRLIGQLSEPVRLELKKREEEDKKNSVKNECKNLRSYKYIDCDLRLLEDAISNVFCNKLTDGENTSFNKFRPMRNKFIHADFINLMKRIDVIPVGREIEARTGTRKLVKNDDIKEAINSMDRNGGFEFTKSRALEVYSILKKLFGC